MNAVKKVFALIFLGYLALSGLHWAGADEPRPPASPATPEGLDYFEKHIRPVLVDRCYRCHSDRTKVPMGKLRLDSREGVLAGGENGPVVLPGVPEKSRILRALRYSDKDLQMPPDGPLSPEEIAHFETWIKMGAPDPRHSAAPVDKAAYTIDFTAARQFWSFRPVQDPPIPAVRDKRRPLNPIDHFILAKLEAQHLTPVPPADKRTLLRRATFDLIGFPPTPAEVEVFLKDTSPKAFEKVIDRLLASPQYGERWGRHWLDLVRYADTSGCNSDFPIPSAYRYRNYVIRSFNRDKPYDQFLREQLAGDLLPAKDDAERYEHIVATGYLAIARRFGSRANEFHLTIEDTIDNVGKAMLGLSVSCARCHDHKFDPIPTTDYYALYGIFNSTKYAFPGTEIYRHTKDFVPLAPSAETTAFREYEKELAALDDQIEKLTQEKPALQAKAKSGTPPAPGARTLEQVMAEMELAKNRLKDLEEHPVLLPKAYAVSEGTPANAKVQKKGDPKALGDEAPRGFLQILGGQRLPDGAKGSGRYELAHWITDPKNPLAARVMVNRIWQHHFDRGLVQTPNDFGARGKAPMHPELLDYLATRFIESGWSVKAMHKRIMLSRAYQLSSADHPKNAAVDVNNDFLWRFNRRRLSAEEIRDAMLFVSGALDPSMGEEHSFPPEGGWRYTQHKPFVEVYENSRRSVYLMQQRIKKQPFLEIFDGADTNASTAYRPLSTTPIQALFMMNAPLAHDLADKLSARIGASSPLEARRIDYAYRLLYGRPVTPEELRMGEEYLRRCRSAMVDSGMAADQAAHAALASYARMLLSSNEFFFID